MSHDRGKENRHMICCMLWQDKKKNRRSEAKRQDVGDVGDIALQSVVKV